MKTGITNKTLTFYGTQFKTSQTKNQNKTITEQSPLETKILSPQNKLQTAFNKQFTNPTKYTTKKENRKIDRHTKQLKSTYITYFY